MPNTVYGPYAAHNWIAGDAANATRLNNLESQAADAFHGFNPDLIGAGFVLSGVTCTKDGTIANQLDIASGRAYVLLSDGTVGLIVVVADNTHTTSTINTTYNLYLQPDGTWYWSTSNAPATNSLYICTAATDASGNITTVTDKRVQIAKILSGLMSLGLPNNAVLFYAGLFSSFNAMVTGPATSVQTGGTTVGHLWQTFDGAAVKNTLAVGTNDTRNGLTVMSTTGGVVQVASQPTAGSFGLPVIVAQSLRQVVTVTSQTTIVTFTAPATALYRASATFKLGNATPGSVTLFLGQWTEFDGTASAASLAFAANVADAFVSIHNKTGLTSGQSFFCLPITFWAQTGTQVTITYTDNAGTPNDTVTCIVERLA